VREGEAADGTVERQAEAGSKQKGLRPNGGRPAQRWQITKTNQEETAELAREARLPEVLAALLTARGIRGLQRRLRF
jgi:predicted ArsR family transcriptional regulator